MVLCFHGVVGSMTQYWRGRFGAGGDGASVAVIFLEPERPCNAPSVKPTLFGPTSCGTTLTLS